MAWFDEYRTDAEIDSAEQRPKRTLDVAAVVLGRTFALGLVEQDHFPALCAIGER
jgi:hypothetical protein